jgi:hypothetical protein
MPETGRIMVLSFIVLIQSGNIRIVPLCIAFINVVMKKTKSNTAINTIFAV